MRILIVLALSACGGVVVLDPDSGGGGGNKPTGGPTLTPDPTATASAGVITCGPATGWGNGVDKMCTTGQQWSCSPSDVYEVICTCPDQRCLCRKNSVVTNVTATSGCPTCTFSAQQMALICGFPH